MSLFVCDELLKEQDKKQMESKAERPGMKAEVTRDPLLSVSCKSGTGKKMSANNQLLDGEDKTPVKGCDIASRKSRRSALPEASDLVPCSLVSTTLNDQSLFLVLGEYVNCTVLPDNLKLEENVALVSALQDCHSIQQLIKCLLSYRVSIPGDKVMGLVVEKELLQSKFAHLEAKNATLMQSFEDAKENSEQMFCTCQCIEANNIKLNMAIKYCLDACKVMDVLGDLCPHDAQGLAANGRSGCEYSCGYDLFCSSDRECFPLKQSKARVLLHSLDANLELPHYHVMPNDRKYPEKDHTSLTLVQSTGTSSFNGGTDCEISCHEVKRLKFYYQAMRCEANQLVESLSTVNGVSGHNLMKEQENVKDCKLRGSRIIDLEEAANAEELYKIKEEMAELKSELYLMHQKNRKMELQVAHQALQQRRYERIITELKRRERRDKANKEMAIKSQGDQAPLPPVCQLEASNRERQTNRRYDELFSFLDSHIKESQDTTSRLFNLLNEFQCAYRDVVEAYEMSKKQKEV